MRETRNAVAVSTSRVHAGESFGGRFDDLRLESYDAVPDLAEAGVVALSGGSAMLPLLERLLGASAPGRELHLHLADEVRAAVADLVTTNPGWVVTDLRHARDGQPVVTLTLDPARGGALLALDLETVTASRPVTADWPAEAPHRRGATPGQRVAAPPPARALARRRLPVLRGRTRSAALAVLMLGVLAAVALIVIGLAGGFQALVVVLLLGIAALLALTLLGLAYVARSLIRLRADERHHLAVTERTITVVRNVAARAENRRRRGQQRSNQSMKRLVQGQQATQEYLATFAGKQVEIQAGDAERNRLAHLATQRQVQALLHLDRLVQPAITPPMGGWAASPDLLAMCLDLLLERRPSCVVETGSGISTLYLAAAAEKYGLDCTVVALEHNENYARSTRELLERNGLSHRAEVRLAPLCPTGLPGHDTPWYDTEALSDLADIGMLIVDGPPEATGPDPRYPAVPLLAGRLAERCVVIADDVIRAADRRAAERWHAEDLTDFDYTLRTDLEKHAAVLRRG